VINGGFLPISFACSANGTLLAMLFAGYYFEEKFHCVKNQLLKNMFKNN
jgi:hypothetical protein